MTGAANSGSGFLTFLHETGAKQGYAMIKPSIKKRNRNKSALYR